MFLHLFTFQTPIFITYILNIVIYINTLQYLGKLKKVKINYYKEN